MKRTLLIIGVIVVLGVIIAAIALSPTKRVEAQVPSLRVNAELSKQLQQIAASQKVLSDEFIRLENVKLTIKYRACLEAKMDAEACDKMDVIADKEGFVFQPKPAEKKP